MQGNFMRENIMRFFAFSAGIGILVLGLKFFNWLPLMVQIESMREYRDVELAAFQDPCPGEALSGRGHGV
jgi:hypothetical protein